MANKSPNPLFQSAKDAALHKALERPATAVVARAAQAVGGEAAKKAFVVAARGTTAKAVAQMGARQGAQAVMRTNAAGAVVSGVIDQALSLKDFASGKIDGAELGKQTVINVAGVGGTAGGAASGAALGSLLCPGVGTVIGGLVGGMLSGWTARSLTSELVR